MNPCRLEVPGIRAGAIPLSTFQNLLWHFTHFYAFPNSDSNATSYTIIMCCDDISSSGFSYFTTRDMNISQTMSKILMLRLGLNGNTSNSETSFQAIFGIFNSRDRLQTTKLDARPH